MDGAPGADGFIDLGVVTIPTTAQFCEHTCAPAVSACASAASRSGLDSEFYTPPEDSSQPSARQYEPAPAQLGACLPQSTLQNTNGRLQSFEEHEINLHGLLAGVAEGMREVALAMAGATAPLAPPPDLLDIMDGADAEESLPLGHQSSPSAIEAPPPPSSVEGDILALHVAPPSPPPHGPRPALVPTGTVASDIVFSDLTQCAGGGGDEPPPGYRD